MKFRRLLATASVLAMVSGSALAAGLFPGIPQENTLLGTELIPADTGLASGQNPQTVLLSVRTLGGAGPIQVATPTTGTTVTSNASTGTLLLTPAGTLASLNVIFPPPPLVEGQVFRVCSTQILTIFSPVAVNGPAPAGSPTLQAFTPNSLSPSNNLPACFEWVYTNVNGLNSWFRIQ